MAADQSINQWPPQADATAAAAPPPAGEPVGTTGTPTTDQLRDQLDTIIADVHRAMAALSTVGPSAVEAEKRTGLLGQYDELEVAASELATRFDPALLEDEGYRLGLAGDIDQFQAQAGLFINAIQEIAGSIHPVQAQSEAPSPATKRPRVLYWLVGGAAVAVISWGVYRLGRGPIRAR